MKIDNIYFTYIEAQIELPRFQEYQIAFDKQLKPVREASSSTDIRKDIFIEEEKRKSFGRIQSTSWLHQP